MLAPFDGLNKDEKIHFKYLVYSGRYGYLCLYVWIMYSAVFFTVI